MAERVQRGLAAWGMFFQQNILNVYGPSFLREQCSSVMVTSGKYVGVPSSQDSFHCLLLDP